MSPCFLGCRWLVCSCLVAHVSGFAATIVHVFWVVAGLLIFLGLLLQSGISNNSSSSGPGGRNSISKTSGAVLPQLPISTPALPLDQPDIRRPAFTPWATAISPRVCVAARGAMAPVASPHELAPLHLVKKACHGASAGAGRQARAPEIKNNDITTPSNRNIKADRCMRAIIDRSLSYQTALELGPAGCNNSSTICTLWCIVHHVPESIVSAIVDRSRVICIRCPKRLFQRSLPCLFQQSLIAWASSQAKSDGIAEVPTPYFYFLLRFSMRGGE